MTVAFRIEATPRPSNQRRAAIVHGHARVVQSPEVRQRQAVVAALCAQYRPTSPIDGPVQLTVQFVLPRPKSLGARGSIQHTKRPDLDNLLKTLLDGLRDWWRDDAQVVAVNASKRVACMDEQPHTWVEVLW